MPLTPPRFEVGDKVKYLGVALRKIITGIVVSRVDGKFPEHAYIYTIQVPGKEQFEIRNEIVIGEGFLFRNDDEKVLLN